MSRTLKWVLGIVAVLVVLAVIAGAALLWQYRGQIASVYRPNAVQPNGQTAPNAPNGRGFGFGNNGRNPMFGYGFRGPMMGRGFGRMMPLGMFGMGFMFFGGLLRLIVPVMLLVLVAFIFYQLGKRSGVRREAVPVASPPANPPADQNPPQS
jgi:hypothetical protein